MSLFTIKNLSAAKKVKSVNLSTITAEQTARMLATLIEDWQSNTYSGAAYTITNHDDLFTHPYDTASWEDMWKVITAIPRSNRGSVLRTHLFSTSGTPTLEYELDVDNYTQDTVRKVLAAFLAAAITVKRQGSKIRISVAVGVG